MKKKFHFLLQVRKTFLLSPLERPKRDANVRGRRQKHTTSGSIKLVGHVAGLYMYDLWLKDGYEDPTDICW